MGRDSGIITLDDIYVDTTGPCQSSGSCDFEKSLCNWIQPDSEQYSFLRISPKQLLSIDPAVTNTNLSFDITTNSKYGHFIWIGSSFYANIPDKSKIVLLSETLIGKEFTVGGCLKLALYLNGDNDDTINVIQKFQTIDEPFMRWFITGNQGDLWKLINIPLLTYGDNFDIYIETIIAKQSLETNIAIDDIIITKFSCLQDPQTQFSCGDGSFVSKDKVCNFIKDCANGLDESFCGDCDFESNTCAWIDDSEGDLVWERGQAGSVSVNGPPVDHTLGNPNGWYIYVAAIKGDIFDFADLVVDKELGPSSPTCELDFYYHMLGKKLLKCFVKYSF
jgi:hypothetical protein